MPNKKINQLDTRTGAALTDLILIGDPTSGTSFKLTATAFRTLLNNVPYTGATTNVNLGAFNLTAASIIRTGGTSSQFLKADGSVDSSTYQPLLTNPVTGTGASGQVAYWNGTSSQTGSNNLFWNSANNRLGINTNTPTTALQVVGTMKATLVETPLVYSTGSDQLAFGTQGGTPAIVINPSTRNVVIQSGGVFGDSGQRLQVMGDVFIKGSGATSATNALLIQNSSGTNLFRVFNDGLIGIGGASSRPLIYTGSPGSPNLSSETLVFGLNSYNGPTNGQILFTVVSNVNSTTSGTSTVSGIVSTFAPTSGTHNHTFFGITPSINQTGGANGITRGLHVVPTLTAAADWRSIEWSNNSGWGLYGAGTANNYLGGALGIGSASLSNANLAIEKNISGSTSAYGVLLNSVIQSGVTANAYGFRSILTTQAASFTLSNIFHFVASQTTQGAGSIVTTQIGYECGDMNNGYTNIAYRGQISQGTLSWNLYMNGTASNYLAGQLLIGTTTKGTFALDVNGTARVSGAATFGNLINISVGVNSGLKYDSSNYFYVDSASGFVLNSWDYTIINNVSGTGYGGMLIRSGTTGAKQASAHLQIDSTTKGFLPPRGTNTQMLAIASPATGLIFYDTTNNKLNCYDGTTWQACW